MTRVQWLLVCLQIRASYRTKFIVTTTPTRVRNLSVSGLAVVVLGMGVVNCRNVPWTRRRTELLGLRVRVWSSL